MVLIKDWKYGWLYVQYDVRRLIGFSLDLWYNSIDIDLTLLGLNVNTSLWWGR